MSEASEKTTSATNEKTPGRRAPLVVAVLIALTGAAVAFRDKLNLPEFWKPAEKATATAEVVPPAATPTKAGELPLLPQLQPAPPKPGEQGFDIARISPDGVSVFAGRAAPNSNVTIMADGTPVGTVKVDENGEWTLSTEHKFTSTDPKLTLEAAPPGTRVAAAEKAPPASAQAAVPAAKAPAATAAAPPKPQATDQVRSAPPKSAEQVTTGMIQNLERLVEAARKEDQARAAPPVPAATEPAKSVPKAEAKQPPQAAPEAKVATAQAPPPPARESSSAAPAVIPVPITFEYRRPEFTHEGRRAVELLAEYVRLKGYGSIALSGHADERGSEAENVTLSRQRLEAVAARLREGGYHGKLDLQAKGEGEPYAGVDRGQYTREALFQLDRRVELRLAQ